MACKLNICVYAPFTLEADISVDSASGLQALRCTMYRIRQSLFYLYDVSAGIINVMMNLNQFGHLVLICVETSRPGSWFAMAVLGCRSLVLVIIINNPVINKLKIVIRILSWKVRKNDENMMKKYDGNMMKIWGN